MAVVAPTPLLTSGSVTNAGVLPTLRATDVKYTFLTPRN